MNQSGVKPLDIRKVGDSELLILWDDGERCLYSNIYLQLHCRCASCVDEWTGEQIVKPQDIDADVRILDIQPVGRYGVRFRWSSGCQTGIYTFEYLRSLCPGKGGAAGEKDG